MITQEKSLNQQKIFSLRWKLLLGFTLLFSGVFTVAFYWFYTFSTEKALERLKVDLQNTALGAVKKVHGDESLQLYEVGQRNFVGYSHAPIYEKQLNWFKTVHSIEPRVYPYTMLLGDPATNRRIGEPKVEEGELEIIYLVDSLWLYNPERALLFLEPNVPSPEHLKAFQEERTVIRDLYTDQWGSWLSAYTPLKDSQGNVIGLLGADIEANHVFEVQRAIRQRVIVAFGLTYGSLFVLVYFASDFFMKPILQLTHMAKEIGEAKYEHDFAFFQRKRWLDEIAILANVFEMMVDKVRQREEKLKRQVAELKIEIDEVKRTKQVQEIVETDFFSDLQKKAREIKKRRQLSEQDGEDSRSSETGV
ncbi:hypothetical protein K4A83_09120 [Spirulina subsalsa FACHB-351]|uniref:HAMP domain-containing protein n=1 Tax=Spirulina subsalsa FACHB-351 TaxID=234711 RepID=A0ABT3L5P7_9CYAN|nr:hypothetical protein [Spirulina subsalsa]MCW6036429.1 hypothetical protein [Spirulina subsalsa FACHB-351]